MKRSTWRSSAALLAALLIALPLASRAVASWRAQKVQKVAVLPSNDTVTISPDGRFVADVSTGASRFDGVFVWVRALSPERTERRRALSHPVSLLAFSPRGKSLAMAWHERDAEFLYTKRLGVSVWDLKGRCREFEAIEKDIPHERPTQLRFSPDGKSLWMASADNLRCWAVSSGKLKWQWSRTQRERGSSLTFFSAVSQDRRLYFRSDSVGYTVWDVRTKKQLLQTKLPFLYDSDLIFSPDASLATYYADSPSGPFHTVMDTRSGRVLWRAEAKSEPVFTGDQAVMRDGSSFKVCHARTGKLLRRLDAPPKASVVSCASRFWLYSINSKRELFRQRLR